MSVRQRAADLLYAMCDRSNAKQIVAEMLSYLETADYSIREEMVGVRDFVKKLYFFEISLNFSVLMSGASINIKSFFRKCIFIYILKRTCALCSVQN